MLAHAPIDRNHSEPLIRTRLHEVGGGVRFRLFLVEPSPCGLMVEDDGHPVVKRGHERVQSSGRIAMSFAVFVAISTDRA